MTSSVVNLQADKADVEIRVHDFVNDEVEDITWSWENDLPAPAHLVSSIYEAYMSDGEGAVCPTFEEAVVRHRLLSAIFRSSDSGREGCCT